MGTAAETPEVKKAPPIISSSAGAKAGEAGVGLVLFMNDGAQENAPDVNGYIQSNGERTYVSGWFVKAGVSKETEKEYGAFVTLRSSKREGDKFVTTGEGTASGVNNWKGVPVDETHRSRVIANFKTADGVELVATGYATKQLADSADLGASLGFTGKVVAKSDAPEAEADAPARSGPKP